VPKNAEIVAGCTCTCISIKMNLRLSADESMYIYMTKL